MTAPHKQAELVAQWFDLLHEIIRQIQREFRKSGRTYADLAAELGWTPKQTEDRIRAKCKVELRQMSDLARVLGCRVRATVERLDGQQTPEELR